MARIRVKDLSVRTFIGIKEDEILNKQDVLINLTILYPANDAVEGNDIDHALNYRTITKAIIQHVEGNRFALLERLTHGSLHVQWPDGSHTRHGQPHQHLVSGNHPHGGRQPTPDTALAGGRDQGQVPGAGNQQKQDDCGDKSAIVGYAKHDESPRARG